MDNWVAFDIGTFFVKVAVVHDGQPIIKTYPLLAEENIYFSGINELSESRLSFISRFIKLYKATDVVFVIPPDVHHNYYYALYDVAKKDSVEKVRFIESYHSTIALYSFLIGKKCQGKNLVIDFGYSKTTLSLVNNDDGNSTECKIFDKVGVSRIDNLLLEAINEKGSSDIYSKAEIGKAREGLSYGYVSYLSQNDGHLRPINRDEFNAVFDENVRFLDTLNDIDGLDRIFLTGGGSLIPRFSELILNRLSILSMAHTRVIRGLKTSNGNFHCQTASVLGALIYVSNKNKVDYMLDGVLLSQCSNPYCRILQPEMSVECKVCRVDLEAKAFYRCKNCGTVVQKPFFDNKNNFCSNCGMHKIEQIKNY